MSKDDSKKRTTPKQAGNISEPPAENAVGVIKSLSTGNAYRHWTTHRSDGDAAGLKTKHGRGWQLDRLREVVAVVFRKDGGVPANLTLKEIGRRIEPEYKKRNWKLPGPDSIARFLGRRNRRA